MHTTLHRGTLHRRTKILTLTALLVAVLPTIALSKDGFTTLFNGKNLDGWRVHPKERAGDWTVREGVIRAEGSTGASYLIWKDERIADLELELEYRMLTNGNTGIELRGRVDTSGKRWFEAYHADLGHVGIGANVLGAWDMHFAKRREFAIPRAHQVVIDEDGKAATTKLPGAIELADIKKRDWNKVRVVMKGHDMSLFINGKLSSRLVDNLKGEQLDRGFVGLQLHEKGTKIEFRNIRLKKLEPGEPVGQRDGAFRPPFYAFQNGVSFGGPEKEASLLKELGFDGVSQVSGGKSLAKRIAAYEAAGLHVLSVYLNVDDRPITAEQVKPLADRGALIELTVRSMTPKTVGAVRTTAEMASGLGIRVALYPHHGHAVARMAEALDLIAKVDHPNLGVMFNLCHFLRSEKAANLEDALERAGSRLFAVSTCGADLGGTSWSALIQTLDRGSFSQQRLLGALKKLGFEGPVGLQCYGVRGDKRENLERSMAAWKKVLEAL